MSLENISPKTGQEIADKILEYLQAIDLNFQDCIGQAYDNGSNMSGKYNGVQALLTEKNKDFFYVLRITQNKARIQLSQIEPL